MLSGYAHMFSGRFGFLLLRYVDGGLICHVPSLMVICNWRPAFQTSLRNDRQVLSAASDFPPRPAFRPLAPQCGLPYAPLKSDAISAAPFCLLSALQSVQR